ncbi:hypothetical protein WJX84_011914, partial [Apatococcus fuscideae]
NSGKFSAGLCFAAQPSAGDTDSMEEPEHAPDSSMGRPKARRWGGIDFVDPVIPTEQELAEWGSALGFDPIEPSLEP